MTNRLTNHPKLPKLCPGSVKKMILEAGRSQDHPVEGRMKMRKASVGRDLGAFGRHLVPSWAARGSQYRAFAHQGAPKVAIFAPAKTSKTKLELLIEICIKIWSENVSLWMCRTLINALYTSTSVVWAYYGKIVKKRWKWYRYYVQKHENGCPN